MVVGNVLIGSVAGLIAAVIALVLGVSPWLALGLYALVGSVAVVFLTLLRILVGSLADQGTAPNIKDGGDAPKIDPAPGETHTGPRTDIRILAVDDDPFILELIPMISAKAGFSDLTPAASGEEALRLLAESDVAFDCLLLDISMPGMDGIELCRRVRELPGYDQTPIVMLTALRDMQHLGDAYRAGATDYATKPFEIENLIARLRMVQRTSHAEREHYSPGGSSSRDRWGRARATEFELPRQLNFSGPGSLVDFSALSSYLNQVPCCDVADIDVFAVSIDGVETVCASLSEHEFVELFEDLAAAAARCFGDRRSLMAYTKHGVLLVVTASERLLPATEIEIALETQLHGEVAERGARIGVSIGGPIQPQEGKTARARTATGRAIALAKIRALDKQTRPVAGLFKR